MGEPGITSAVRKHPVATTVAVVYVAAFGVFGVLTSSHAVGQYLVVLILGFAFVAWLDSRVGFSAFVIGGLALWGFLHMAGGIVPIGGGRVLYNLRLVPGYMRFDNLVHAIGFGVGTVACWEGLRHRLADSLNVTPGITLLIALAGMGVGAVNEVVEFLATRVFPETNVGGFVNTGWDLVFNLFGSTLAALIIRHRSKRHRDTLPSGV